MSARCSVCGTSVALTADLRRVIEAQRRQIAALEAALASATRCMTEAAAKARAVVTEVARG